MDSITLQNYRCFGSEEQTARLAPLTLLVGPNSTGKTSFLALIRALWDVAFREVVPNFREPPYDLGSFPDIVHRAGGRSEPANCFTAGFDCHWPEDSDAHLRFCSMFDSLATAPFPVVRYCANDETSIELSYAANGTPPRFRIRQGEWGKMDKNTVPQRRDGLVSFQRAGGYIPGWFDAESNLLLFLNSLAITISRPLAGGPVQSRPLRTYDPVQLAQDLDGASVPSYLAALYRNDPDEWQRLKTAMDAFGRKSGLFDEILVKSFGKSDGDPFQLHIRKFGKRRKGPSRNLIDAGYGVSQALPLIVEMLKTQNNSVSGSSDYAPSTLLLQQPEVHLHPQAQAALGTLFCQTAAAGRQLVIETHSDYIIDRVRMDVRDGTTDLKPADVSILYFEPGDLNVKIHSIRLDDMGNVLDAPPGYRQFFAEELRRSIGI